MTGRVLVVNTSCYGHYSGMEKKSKTQAALALVEQGATPNAAANQVGISASAVYRAMGRREGKEVCPCCSQVVREGFSINHAVLKK